MKNEAESTNLIAMNTFWAELASHLTESGDKQFLSEHFMFLSSKREFTLACCFLPDAKHAEFNLESDGRSQRICAKQPFLVFVKELKAVGYEKKFGVFLNQRFFNPHDQYAYEDDGTRVEKAVEEYIVRRPYCLQTLITNTSGTNLELQLLMDLPTGAIPLRELEHTKIQNINLNAYSTLSFERYFYFPHEGHYQLYPANVFRADTIIGKAEPIRDIEVKLKESKKKMESFDDVMRSGDKEAILKYVEGKNIFDGNIFDPYSVLWMLRDKDFFKRLVGVLRGRKFYERKIWMFGMVHRDMESIKEFLQLEGNWFRKVERKLPIFEYHPYYSNRVHKFLNENKSTIKNAQFKNNYYGLLMVGLLNDNFSTAFKLALVYYLLLQDRVDEAHHYYQARVSKPERDQHQLQTDYIECFIGMYKEYPTFDTARAITKKYANYPVAGWRKLFSDIQDTLEGYDKTTYVEEEAKNVYEPTLLDEGHRIRLNIPENTEIEVHEFEINLEMYFSEFPFQPLTDFSSTMKPQRVTVYGEGKAREETYEREKGAKDIFVEVYYSTEKGKKKKLRGLLWKNPELKVKRKENSGAIQVFYEGKQLSSCYCKVYQLKRGGQKFYRDGYTDITGTFRYALADLEGVSKFALLVMTEHHGGLIMELTPPSQQNFLS